MLFITAITVFSILSSSLVILLVYFLIQNIIFYKSVKNLSTAEKFVKVLETTTGLNLPIRLRAWDGSETGPKGTHVVHFKSKSIVRWFIWSPRFPSFGLMRALVDGNDLDIVGDVNDLCQRLDIVGLTLMEGSFLKYIQIVVSSLKVLLVVLSIFGSSLLCLPPPIPPEEFKPKSDFKKYTPNADKVTCDFAYNISNKFYELLLGQTMVYSCAYYETADMSLDEAQLAKFEDACRKLGLKEGMTVLDIGCGWGSFVIHAAQKYGVTAKGITLSSEQCKYAQEKVKRSGLEKMVGIQFMDFRDLNEIGHYDAVTCFGMMEHIGIKNHRLFAQIVHKLLKPGGKFVLETCCRGSELAKIEKFFTMSLEDHPTLERYFCPSLAVDYIYAYNKLLDETGLEVMTTTNLREHYAMTFKDWVNNLENNEEEILKDMSPGFYKNFKLGHAMSIPSLRTGLFTATQFLCIKANKEA